MSNRINRVVVEIAYKTKTPIKPFNNCVGTIKVLDEQFNRYEFTNLAIDAEKTKVVNEPILQANILMAVLTTKAGQLPKVEKYAEESAITVKV